MQFNRLIIKLKCIGLLLELQDNAHVKFANRHHKVIG